MEYLSNLVLMLILFFTLVSANKDQKAQELRNQIKPGGASTITEGCNDDMRKFGPYNIYTCNCRYLESCDFSNMGKCKTKKCLSGYGGPFCQLRFFHEYLKKNINETKNVFTNVSKKINNFLNITFKKDRRIHSLKFSCQSSVSETNITLKIGSTKFYEGKCKNVTQTGDASGKYLLIETTQKVSFSMLRVFGCSPLWFGPKCDKQCHCANYTECHKISGNCPMGCESGRSGPDCQKLNYENVALKKNASQSSTFNHSTILLNDTCQKHEFNFSADLAVDGNTDQQFERRSCIHTVSKRLHPYWQVDLGESYNISQIRIYHRNSNLYRIRDVAIYVDDTNCNTIQREEEIIDIRCTNILEGRIIKIFRRSRKDWSLNFCEVEVLQCLPGFYGYRCKNSCPECKNSSCEQWTGTCQLGCALGYKLSNTCTACQFGTFGEGCSQTCHCKNNIHCNKKNGSCIPDECEIGYKGFNCQEPCSTGTFGERCLQTCHCKNNDNCNKINGSCGPEGCEAGYKGPTCQESCPIGTFGDGCSQTCHCKKNTNCNKKDGSCILDVCEAGYKGFSCQESCSTGTFGEGCWQTCHCKNNDNCNKKNGSCGPEGCEAGYKGPICQESKFNIYIPIFVGSSIIVIIIVGLIIYFKVKRSKKKEKDTSKRVQIVSLQGSIEMDPVADNIDDDYTYIEPVDNKEYINMNTMYAR